MTKNLPNQVILIIQYYFFNQTSQLFLLNQQIMLEEKQFEIERQK